MTSSWWKREKYVAINGQTKRFRIIKWIIFIILFSIIYWEFGTTVLLKSVAGLALAGTTLHFFLSWKTNGWRKNWGPYKTIKIPEDLR